MAYQLRVFALLIENLGLFPAPVRQLTTICNSSARDPTPETVLWSLCPPGDTGSLLFLLPCTLPAISPVSLQATLLSLTPIFHCSVGIADMFQHIQPCVGSGERTQVIGLVQQAVYPMSHPDIEGSRLPRLCLESCVGRGLGPSHMVPYIFP